MELEYGGRVFPVAAGDLVIGSGSDSTIVLTAPGVLPRHAVIRPLGTGMAVAVPGSPGAEILVNGARLGGDPTPLMHGDKIRIGGEEITVADPRRGGATAVISAVPPSTREPSPETSATSVGRLVSLTDGREYRLGTVPFVIGREAGAGVVLTADAASRRHAEIVPSPEGDRLVDLSANGVWVNDERVLGKATLRSGDVIRIAGEELRYYPPESSSPPTGAGFRLSDTMIGQPAVRPAPPMQSSYLAPSEPALASLLVKKGQRKGDRIEIRTPVVNLGRANYNDIVLPDASISSSHAKLQLREGVWMLSDLGSTNGSRVDGESVAGEAPLSPGATIGFGEVSILFEPRDKGAAKGSGTQVLRVPLAASQRATPEPREAVPGGGRRQPVPPQPFRRAVLLFLAVTVALALAVYFFLD